jgi:hypothetical protein
MRIFKFFLPAIVLFTLVTSCRQKGYQSTSGISNRRAKATVRYYKHQNEGLRLSSAATRYNVNRDMYQSEGLKLSSKGY